MDPKIAEAIGLLRHQIISPVLMDSGRSQMKYFREIAQREWDFPGRNHRIRFSPTTLKGWLNRYKKHGFNALIPKTRSDSGGFRRLSEEKRQLIRKLRKENLSLSVVQFYELAEREEILGIPPICQATLRRFLIMENLFAQKEANARKRFEMSRFGELWTGDFMHGPLVIVDVAAKRRKKAILMAIIDDHSRYIVGGEFGLQENSLLLENVFKSAILTHGCPDRLYVDNGSTFSSHYLSRVCAHMKIGLVHSKPYDSPSRGKIERFFRTVREQFLSQIHPDAEITLSDLNEKLSTWLRQEYHHRNHSGIDARPIDRYQSSLGLYPLKRVDEESLNEFFLASVERVVTRDCVVSFNGIAYEVPPHFVGKRVVLKFALESPKEIYLYDNGIRVSKLQPVDARYNAKTYRPGSRDPHIPFQGLIAEAKPGSSSEGGARHD